MLRIRLGPSSKENTRSDFLSDLQKRVGSGRVKRDCSLFGSIVETLGDLLNHPLGVLVTGIVLDDLKDC
jgi:hypothetical protein